MKILAFSDLHQNIEATNHILEHCQPADVLVAAGDFANKGVGANDTISLLKTTNKPCVLVGGNHDDFRELAALCKNWTNGHFLHGQSVELAGVQFFGLGGEVPNSHDVIWNSALSEGEATLMLENCPKNCVLVTHTPPHECADLQRSGSRGGSRAIRHIVEQKQPLLHLCGHVHFSHGQHCSIGATPVHNLGPTLNWFDVT